MFELIKVKGLSCHDEWYYICYKGQKVGEIHSCQNGDSFYYHFNMYGGGVYDGKRHLTIIDCKAAFIKNFKESNIIKDEKEQIPKIKCKQLLIGDGVDFYPTPSKLCGMLFSKINFDNVQYILEPSAGKGDILDNLHRFKNSSKYRHENIDIDVIEIDPNLQYILKGKEYRVVYDDFLTYNTKKKYDLIIMNPPFSNGCQHLLKAIEMQKSGGQIACVLNAETLRNPYTNERRLLLQKLHEHNAIIHYINDSFKNAERKTDVCVALIWLDIPKNYGESDIYSKLKRAVEIEEKHNGDITDLTLGGMVDNIVSRYDFEARIITELIREYHALLPYIQSQSEGSKYDAPIIEMKIGGSGNKGLNDALRMLRYKYWSELLNKKELISRFTATLRDKYGNMVNDMKDYDFNYFNVYQVVERMQADVIGGVREEIYKIFDKLSSEYSYYPESAKNIHYFNGWKTNKAHKVGMKAIFPAYGVFSDYKWSRDEFRVYEAYNAIADIEKVFNYIDCDSTSEVNLTNALENAAACGISKNIQCKYFTVTFYKKGTVHIKINSSAERIIDRLNIYVCRGRNWLPPSYGRKYYDDMTKEEQSVIDDFQGKEKYSCVVANPSLYLYETTNNNLLALTTNE